MDLFPLLTLPQDTLQELLDRFEFDELFQLAQCSRKASNVVKTYSASFDETPFCLSVTTGTISVVSVRSFHQSSSIHFNFFGERNPTRLYGQFPKTYNFDGQLIDFCEEEDFPRFVCTTPHTAVDIFKFAHYFETLFNTKLFSLTIIPDEDSLKESLKSEWLQKSQPMQINVDKGRVTHEEMAHVLEFFGGVKHLSLDCSPGQYFSYDKTISAYNLHVGSATWIKRHNLLKLDCESVDIRDCVLTNEDLNAFLRHWLQNGDEKLKYMCIRGKYCSSEEERKNAYKFDQEEVLKGLPTLPGAPKRQDAIEAFVYFMFVSRFETGMDLRRESDGALATVIVREENDHKVAFIFVVWQEPDPNVVAVVP